MGVRIYFARAADGTLVDVKQVRRGLSCEWRCLGCGDPLVARQGQVRSPHFAHATKSDDRRSAESALHLAAKEALRGLPEIQLRLYPARISVTDVLGREHDAWVNPGLVTYRYESADLESRVGKHRLDAVLQSEAQGPLGVEICVSHAVDSEKAEDLAACELPVVEIDLEPLLNVPLDRAVVRAAVREAAERTLITGADRLDVPLTCAARRRLGTKCARIARAVHAARKITERDSELRHRLAAKLKFSQNS